MIEVYEVEIIEDDHFYTLSDICNIMGLQEDFVVTCVDEGLLEVASVSTQHWRFNLEEVARIQTAFRLQRDLNLDIDALGLVLDLLEENQKMKQELEFIKKRLAGWEAT